MLWEQDLGDWHKETPSMWARNPAQSGCLSSHFHLLYVKQHMTALYQGLQCDSLLWGLLDPVRQNNSPAPHSHTKKTASEKAPQPVCSCGKCLAGALSERYCCLAYGRSGSQGEKPMFNLAQRQLRLSLWGTELANRSTCTDSNPAKEALSAAMLGTWTRIWLRCSFCCVRRAAVLSCLCSRLHSGLPPCCWETRMG